MVRNYIKKTDRCDIDENAVSSAVKAVIEGTMSLRKAAGKYGVKPGTLQHRVEKQKQRNKIPNDESEVQKQFFSKYSSQQVFTVNQESELAEYIVHCSKLHYGLTVKQFQLLAFEFALKLNCKFPVTWEQNKMAGIDWVAGFRARNSNISLRKPENTSVARSFGFSKSAVSEFYQNYESVLIRYQFTGNRIFNFDETGITTVLSTPKVLAEKSQKQVGQIVSGERGELVTFGAIISATGNAIPPVFVFPRVHYKTHFLEGAPEGSLGLATRSGWMNANLYLKVLEHIKNHTNCSLENPILLLCDNCESHISIEAVDYCRKNGIVYVSFPPHTTHRIQPLDVSVFGPFKGKLKIAFNDWHLNNPGRALTIYDIPKLAKLAYFEAFTAKNIVKGFEKPGIHPFNKLAFSDSDFAPQEVYQPTTPSTSTISSLTSSSTSSLILPTSEETSEILQTHIAAGPSTPIALKDIRPFPTISPRIPKNTRRERGKSRIYTDSPEKNRLEAIHKARQQRLLATQKRQQAKNEKQASNLQLMADKNKKVMKKKVVDCDSSLSSFDEDDIEYASSDVSETFSDIVTVRPSPDDINIDDFLLIQFSKKKSVVHYIGKVLHMYERHEYHVSYLRKKSGRITFVFPSVRDEAAVHIADVILKLPPPLIVRGTERTSSIFKFSVDFSPYNVQ